MKLRHHAFSLLFLGLALGASAQDNAVTPAAAAKPAITAEATDILERFVSWLHRFAPGVDDQLFHWIACAIVFVLAILLRHVITNIIFHYLKKLAEKTETTLDDKLFPALEGPVATLVMVGGIFAALTVLQLSAQMDRIVNGGATIAILGVLVWGLIKAGGAVLDHVEEIAHQRQMTVATFMPLIKKTLFVFAVIVGLLLIADSLGAKIGVFLTSLGIGGLAFALAAQDTIANLFGSFVVVIDQPFKVGDTVKVGASTGTVEDIGLRSTKIRLVDKSLVVIPNKLVSSEAIVNLSRFASRRVEQTLNLAYDTTPDRMEALVREIRGLITAEPEIDPSSVHVYFRDLGASSLDIWLVYVTRDADFAKHMALRQRLNLAFMRAVEARGLSFAFPTQTVHVASLPPGAPASGDKR
ncbi:MAG TPA: mechanosensitive ion channel family protein [Lacunisphaera sp.]|nr:mechanosensitive ion channel family protein [Lacunisphaera sp.]